MTIGELISWLKDYYPDMEVRVRIETVDGEKGVVFVGGNIENGINNMKIDQDLKKKIVWITGFTK